MSTKEKILATALQLFNKNGIDRVTTRDIASSMSISQGNLHYHFANKEVIILRLFEDFLSKIDRASSFESKNEFTRELVLKSMKSNYKIMYAYRFFFKENKAVWRRLPEIRTGTTTLLERKKNDIKSLIRSYQKLGVLRDEFSSDQIDFLTDQFIFTISSWLTASEYMNKKTGYFVDYTFRTWLPYLTNDEMKRWEKILNKNA